MNITAVFLCGLILTGLAAVGVVWYFNAPLRQVLVELCGTAERAGFWAAFSNITLVLAPVLFALHRPEEGVQRDSVVLAAAGQLQWGFAGLLISVVVLGIVLSQFIVRAPLPPAGAAPQKP